MPGKRGATHLRRPSTAAPRRGERVAGEGLIGAAGGWPRELLRGPDLKKTVPPPW